MVPRSPSNPGLSTPMSGKKINLALLMGDLYNAFECEIYAGARQFVRENNVNLICFIGSELNSPTGTNSRRNDIYYLISSYNVDGILGISGTLGNHIGQQRLADFYRKFDPLPIVSIGVQTAGIPFVGCENEAPMRKLIVHLIEEHGCRRIAYIKGRDINPDTQARLKVYKEVLSEYNLPVQDELILSGKFDTLSGRKAVETLFKRQRKFCDAIVSTNDYMAIGAIEELLRRGIAVPDDVKVVGFDDITESRFFKVPLTTVRQPIFNMGYNAAKLLFTALRDAGPVENIALHSQLVIRKSCGCDVAGESAAAYESVFHKTRISIKNPDKIKNQLVPKLLSLISDQISIRASSYIRSEWIEKIVDSLITAIGSHRQLQFIKTIEVILDESKDLNLDSGLWYFVFSFIFNNIFSLLANAKNLSYAKTLFNAVVDVINNFGIKQHEIDIINTYERTKQLSIISKGLASTFDLNGLKEILCTELPKFGIRSFYISVFENTGNTPKILMPYHFEEVYAGFMVYEVQNTDNEILEILTAQISNALKVINLYKSNKKDKTFNDQSKTSKYVKSSLSKEKSHEYFRKLIHFMESNKAYMISDLTPDYVARRIHISRHNLSYIINEYADMNFYDFINSYRIKEIITYLQVSKNENTKMIDIAMNFGFKSKSTFNKIFKKYTNMTPTEFRKLINQNKNYKDSSVIRVFTRHHFES
ncbi:MAG: substrate-binding domain-containing protein [Spirochaetia bacterium]